MQGVIAVSKACGIFNRTSSVIAVDNTTGIFNPPREVIAGCRLSTSGLDGRLHVSCGINNAGFCKVSLKAGPSIFFPNQRGKPSSGANSRKRIVRVRADGNQDKISSHIAPLDWSLLLASFLCQILISHPHLLPAAIDQQLETLAADRDAAAMQELPATSGTEIVLYRRIAELKAKERRKVLEEIIYALVVQKFMDAGVSLIPSMSMRADPSGKVDTWPNQDTELEAAHSTEALEMIREHLSLVLGNRNALSDS